MCVADLEKSLQTVTLTKSSVKIQASNHPPLAGGWLWHTFPGYHWVWPGEGPQAWQNQMEIVCKGSYRQGNIDKMRKRNTFHQREKSYWYLITSWHLWRLEMGRLTCSAIHSDPSGSNFLKSVDCHFPDPVSFSRINFPDLRSPNSFDQINETCSHSWCLLARGLKHSQTGFLKKRLGGLYASLQQLFQEDSTEWHD